MYKLKQTNLSLKKEIRKYIDRTDNEARQDLNSEGLNLVALFIQSSFSIEI